jgi:hypothetical protein
MVTITPLTVAEILERAGLMPDAIAKFTTANPTKTASLSKFQNALRARKYSVHDGLLVGLDDSPVWDCYDSITLEDLSLWFISVDPKNGEPFDWDTQFTTTVFTLFGFTSGDTSPPEDKSTAPTLPVPTSDQLPTPDIPQTNVPDTTSSSSPAPTTTPTSPVANTTYIHSYHDSILLADNQALARRVGTAATTVLTAHPLWTSSQISGAVTIHSKNFLNTDLDPLLSSEADAIHEWYRVLTHQATATGIDLCPLLAFDKNHALWPRNLPSGIVFEMSSTLLLKLQRSTVIDRVNNQVLHLLYQLHITFSNSKLAAYYFLHALLSHAFNALAGNLDRLPRYTDSMDAVKFATQIMSYCQAELAKNRSYTDHEISLHFLKELDLHGVPVQVPLKALEDLNITAIIPDSLLFTTLALKFARSGIASDIPSIPTAHRLQQPRPSPTDTATTPRRAGGGRGNDSTSRTGPFRQPEDVQCKACNIWGHSAQSCSGLAKIASINAYIAANPTHADTAIRAWKDLHSANHRNSVAHSLHLLTGVDTNTIVLDDLTDGYRTDFQ